jgi:hypothetical protein
MNMDSGYECKMQLRKACWALEHLKNIGEPELLPYEQEDIGLALEKLEAIAKRKGVEIHPER